MADFESIIEYVLSEGELLMKDRKGLLYISSGIFFLIFFCFSYRYISFSRAENVVLYEKYIDGKDDEALDIILERNKFWLFHDHAEESKKKILENIVSGRQQDDFNSRARVPYYTRVARVNDKVVGFITYFGSDEKKIGRIHLLAVDSDFRRLGVAQNLVQFALEYFRSKGYTKVFLYTRPENVRAKKLYKKMSFYEVDQGDNVHFLFDQNPGDILAIDL